VGHRQQAERCAGEHVGHLHLRVVPDVNHYIEEDAPERITEAILKRFC
jgi:pimeloyl-ACP methyl ester carboxylesterase